MSLLKIYVDGAREAANDISDMLLLLDYTENVTRKYSRGHSQFVLLG